MGLSGRWAKQAYGPNGSMGQTTHGTNRSIGRPDERAIGCMGARRVLWDKTWERISGISLWDSTSIRRALNFRGFALPWGNSFAHCSWSRSAAFFIWKGIPHGNAREFGTARSGAD